MKHKKLIIGATLLFGLGLSGLQAQTSMYLEQMNNTQTAFSLSSIRKLSFPTGNITVSKTTGSSDTYALSSLRYLKFGDTETAIATIKNQGDILQLYPNPVVDVLNIQLFLAEGQIGEIEILSIEGKVVYKKVINSTTNVYQVNVSTLPKGIFLCKINNGITTETTKFFKK